MKKIFPFIFILIFILTGCSCMNTTSDISDSEDYLNIDKNLIGRWRSTDGGVIEISPDGYLTECDLKVYNLSFIASDVPNSIMVESENGELIFYNDWWLDYDYKLKKARFYDQRELYMPPSITTPYSEYDPNGDITEFDTDNTSLVGSWGLGAIASYTFYDDNTGVYSQGGKNSGIEFPILYWENTANGEDPESGLVSMEIGEVTSVDYTLDGDILTLWTNNGALYYQKIS